MGTAAPRILLVEDSPAQAELLYQALAWHGLDQAVHLEPGIEAARTYLETQLNRERPALPQLVLADLKLRQESGLELVRQLREHPRLATLPIVMLTDSDDPMDIRASYASGANGYVVKPATFEELVNLTGAVCAYWLHWNQTSQHEGSSDSRRPSVC